MPRLPTANRYAEAAFEIAEEQGTLLKWQDDLPALGEIVSDEQVRRFLATSKAPLKTRIDTVQNLLPELDPLVGNLLAILITRGMAGLLPGITQEYQRLLDEHRGVRRAYVSTAVAVDQDVLERISQRLVRTIGFDVVIESKVDPSIIGGFVARVGDLLVDGSTRTRLNQLRRKLMQEAA